MLDVCRLYAVCGGCILSMSAPFELLLNFIEAFSKLKPVYSQRGKWDLIATSPSSTYPP